MTDDVILLEPGDERAQKIAKAMASPTAGDILQAMKDGPKTSSDLADLLHLPMSTVKYHIGNLLDAGVLEVAETRYSVKGREVKVYTLKDQLLIVAPRTTSIRSLLLKYASIFGVFLLVTLVVVAMTPIVSEAPPSAPDGSVPGIPVSPSQSMISPVPSSVPVSATPVATYWDGDTRKETGETTGGAAGGGGAFTITPGPTRSTPATLEGTQAILTTPATAVTVTGTPAITIAPVTNGAAAQTQTPTSAGFVTSESREGPIPFPFSPALIFFAGGIVVLAAVITYDMLSRVRKQ